MTRRCLAWAGGGASSRRGVFVKPHATLLTGTIGNWRAKEPDLTGKRSSRGRRRTRAS